MAAETLQVIELAEPHFRIVVSGEETPLLRRGGSGSFACGGCGALLVEDAWSWEIYNLVFHCPSCGAHNEVGKPATEGR